MTGAPSSGAPAPTERQVLYAVVSAGFVVVVAVLVGAAWLSGLAPRWWSIVASTATLAVGWLVATRWRDTRRVLTSSTTWFLTWTVVTLLVT